MVTKTFGGDAMIYMAFLSDQMSIQQINDYVRRNIQPELSTLEGVGEAKVLSDREFAMRVWLDPAIRHPPSDVLPQADCCPAAAG